MMGLFSACLSVGYILHIINYYYNEIDRKKNYYLGSFITFLASALICFAIWLIYFSNVKYKLIKRIDIIIFSLLTILFIHSLACSGISGYIYIDEKWTEDDKKILLSNLIIPGITLGLSFAIIILIIMNFCKNKKSDNLVSDNVNNGGGSANVNNEGVSPSSLKVPSALFGERKRWWTEA